MRIPRRRGGASWRALGEFLVVLFALGQSGLTSGALQTEADESNQVQQGSWSHWWSYDGISGKLQRTRSTERPCEERTNEPPRAQVQQMSRPNLKRHEAIANFRLRLSPHREFAKLSPGKFAWCSHKDCYQSLASVIFRHLSWAGKRASGAGEIIIVESELKGHKS